MDEMSILPGQSDDGLKKARTSTHTSAPMDRVEVITRGARRRWHASEKRAIVLESLAPGVVVSAVCRRHGISSGQLSTWRQELREGKLGDPRAPSLQFAEAVVVEPPIIRPFPQLLRSGAPDHADGSVATFHKRQQTRRRPTAGGVIEIILPNGVVVRVGGDVDQVALSKILAVSKSA